jgi:hypothetical protein
VRLPLHPAEVNQLAGVLATLPPTTVSERLRDKVRYLSLLTYLGSDAEGHARDELQRLWLRLRER